MARAILNHDRIKKITLDESRGVEIGDLPQGVGLERLRWDGEKLVDLASLDSMWVNVKTHTLHAIKLPNTQNITMSYNDRNKIIDDAGTLRIKTQEEINLPKQNEYKARRKAEYPDVHDQVGAIMDYLKGKKDLTKELEDMINEISRVKAKWDK